MNERMLHQAPIELLSHQAWQRVETAVFARLDEGLVMPSPAAAHRSYAAPRARRALRWHWTLGMGLSVAAAAVAWIANGVHASSPAALANEEPLMHSGVATATAPDERALEAPPAPIAPATPVATAQDGLHVATGHETRSIAVGDSRFTLAERSEMVARGNDREGWNVSLSRGRVVFDVAPRRSRPPFIIHSGDVQVRVVGTRFSVHRQGASTQVRVQRGVVEVEHGGQTVRLGPGDVWLDGVVAGTGHESESEKPKSRGPRRPRTERAAGSDRERRFERAASLESDDPAQALDVYRGLARGTDDWAANALYAAARLELDRGDRRSGVLLLEDYLERFPEGENSLDVQELRSRPGMTPGP